LARRLPVTKTGRSRGVQEQPPMRIESGRFCWMYRDLRGRIPVGNVDGARSILPLNPRIPPQEASTPGSLRCPAAEPVVSSIATTYDREEKCNCRGKLGSP